MESSALHYTSSLLSLLRLTRVSLIFDCMYLKTYSFLHFPCLRRSWGLAFSVAAVETKLGKNRTEAEVKRFTEEKERLEKEKDEIRAQLTQLRKERRELKEMLAGCTGRARQESRWGLWR